VADSRPGAEPHCGLDAAGQPPPPPPGAVVVTLCAHNLPPTCFIWAVFWTFFIIIIIINLIQAMDTCTLGVMKSLATIVMSH